MRYLGHIIMLTVAYICYVPIKASADTRNPIGEKAYYQIDRDPERTASLIQGGYFEALVTKEIPQLRPSKFEISVNYDVRIRFAGRQQGTQGYNLESTYFTSEFLSQLRDKGHIESANFKADHLGYADAQTIDGRFFPNCDLVKLYQFKNVTGYFVTQFFHKIIGNSDAKLPVENIEVTAYIKDDQPILGAVKLDIVGLYSGLPVKVGADLVSKF